RTSPEVLEREVIRPIEETISGIRDLETMRTSSGSWGVRLHLEFRPGTDIDARKIELRERLDRAKPDLPDLVQRINVSSSRGSADEPISTIRIASERDLAEDYYLLEDAVVRPLERIDGVSRVELEGVEPHELEVAVDLQAAREGGVSLAGVGDAVRSARQGRSLGLTRGEGRDAGLRVPALDADPEHYAALPLLRNARASVADDPNLVEALPPLSRLGEVAKISIHPNEERSGDRLNGKRTMILSILRGSGD